MNMIKTQYIFSDKQKEMIKGIEVENNFNFDLLQTIEFYLNDGCWEHEITGRCLFQTINEVILNEALTRECEELGDDELYSFIYNCKAERQGYNFYHMGSHALSMFVICGMQDKLESMDISKEQKQCLNYVFENVRSNPLSGGSYDI